ncbi:Glutamate synthase [NADPH] small chain [hydrothermal vent metagenome]|uniref:Glutamate synthase [NADPH] small chain n=1 Tax=hydrothermal vent metagenome TaxID=652676 RepID=A0A3B0R5N4_9ZZZZ
MVFEKMQYQLDDAGRIASQKAVGEVEIDCDDVILAIGQDNAFPWIEADSGIEFDKWDVPVVDETTFQSTKTGVFFGGDAAFGPKNIIWAVEHGHQAAISIHKHCQGKMLTGRLPNEVALRSTKMGMFEWRYSNSFDASDRRQMQHVELVKRFAKLDVEVELGFSAEQIATEVERCLNCDVQTVFQAPLCEECDACIDICPVECLSITPNAESSEELRKNLTAPAGVAEQALYVSADLPFTGRVMIKDENVCLHCGLCAERCPTAAWDMQEGKIEIHHAIDQDKEARS